MSYYQRTSIIHIDGTAMFTQPEDTAAEKAVAAQISAQWGIQLQSFGLFAAIDWYAQRNGHVVGVLELKARSHASTYYPTVFLNVRKWLAMMLARIGLGVPAWYVVKFTDIVMYIEIAEVDARRMRMGGCKTYVKSRSDIEPVIEIPIEAMTPLRSAA